MLFRQYKFNLQEVEGFRYRARDAWRAVTRIAVREARLKEIKQEIFNSKRLKVRTEIYRNRLNYLSLINPLELFVYVINHSVFMFGSRSENEFLQISYLQLSLTFRISPFIAILLVLSALSMQSHEKFEAYRKYVLFLDLFSKIWTVTFLSELLSATQLFWLNQLRGFYQQYLDYFILAACLRGRNQTKWLTVLL